MPRSGHGFMKGSRHDLQKRRDEITGNANSYEYGEDWED